ncbi:MAG: undecaprenyl/decaprenyl-phosphate alpha-N-acetylglucosaminyl 1-phosphate transferase [Paludibacteraceae bacterium]|nr:undecaprenyl/decaprenyl-phosphate alpha-N-acetylglucosaminyl 1-phosphate transferase [Paludibacteraceae bacterium]
MMLENYTWVCCMVVAFLSVCYINPLLLMIAYKKDITDKPSGRKFQVRPIPVIGGWSLLAAILFSLLIGHLFMPMNDLFIPVLGLCVMFLLGLIDDLIELSYRTKFIFQLIVVSLWWFHGYRFDDLCGLFGIHEIHPIASYLLSLFAGVGLINAHNLLDGIDGLSSGYSIGTTFLCGIYFFIHGDNLFASFSAVFIGALIPFFACNVFSKKYKMFIGDSGALMLGSLSYIFSCRIVHTAPIYSVDVYNFALLLAIYGLPVFDTIRVMSSRMINGTSPFLPDRTHFHHLFVDMGFACYITTFLLLLLSTVVFAGWFMTAALGWCVTVQLVVMVVWAMVVFWGVSGFMVRLKKGNPERYENYRSKAIALSKRSHVFFKMLQGLMDRKNARK